MSLFEPIFEALNRAQIRCARSISSQSIRWTDLIRLKRLAGRPQDLADIQVPDDPGADRVPEDWEAGWEADRVHQLTLALAATPAQRLAWLEDMIALAWRVGALPKSRD